MKYFNFDLCESGICEEFHKDISSLSLYCYLSVNKVINNSYIYVVSNGKLSDKFKSNILSEISETISKMYNYHSHEKEVTKKVILDELLLKEVPLNENVKVKEVVNNISVRPILVELQNGDFSLIDNYGNLIGRSDYRESYVKKVYIDTIK